MQVILRSVLVLFIAAGVFAFTLQVAHAQQPVNGTWVVVPAPAPSVQCSTTAPTVAAQAGFTTMALCNDWTQGLPSTAGTGLSLPAGAQPNTDRYGGQGCWYGPEDSSGCATADSYTHVWYGPEIGQCTTPSNQPEPSGGIHLPRDTDPTYGSGQYAEDFASSLTDQQNGNSGVLLV